MVTGSSSHHSSSAILPVVRRVCSGNCSYFDPQYVEGRKIAGAGTCAHHRSDEPVQVGMKCLWTRAAERKQAIA